MTVSRFAYEGVSSRVVFGSGARHGLADELDRLGLTQVVLIASRSSRAEADILAAALDHRLTWRVDGVRRHVPSAQVDEVVADAGKVDADGVVTLGGGSATGLGRAVARQGLLLVAMPTTYAGSELTPVCADGRALPRTVIYDPELTYGLPPLLTAATGMNAVAHCLEALWAAGASPLSGPLALDGARALCEAIPAAVAEPWDPKARSRALVGACQAAMALATAGPGLHHRLCHELSRRYDLPHAQTHAAVLPHVVGFNEPVLGALAARMAVAVGAGRASTGVHELAARMGLPMSLSELGLPEEGIATVAAAVVADPPPNPRPVDEAALRSLLRAAWEGDPG